MTKRDAENASGGSGQNHLKLDKLDLDILEALLDNARIPFRKLARQVSSDEKTVARRVTRLAERGVVRRFTVDIDYSKFGLNAIAYVGTRTTVDAAVREELFRFFRTQPRILRAEATIGGYEYMFQAIDRDILSLRENVLTPLEPLTAGLSTSIVSKTIRPPNNQLLMRLIRETTGKR